MRKDFKVSTSIVGFTLVELLLVIGLIGILSTMVIRFTNTTGVRGKVRDSQRIADLRKIQVALELYFSDRRVYPIALSWVRVTGSDAMSSALEGGSYINSVPVDPVNDGTSADPCGNDTAYRYNYTTDAAGTGYILTAIMEVATSNDDSACDALNNWGTGIGTCSSYSTGNVCYGVENP